MTRTVAEMVRAGAAYLQGAGIDAPRLDAEVIMAHLLKTERLALYVRPELEVEPEVAAGYNSSLARRGRGFPLQWLTGRQEFMSLELHVEEGVFIPRADTEILVETAIPPARALIGRQGQVLMLDIGTGSGAIAVAMASFLPGLRVRAYDISTVAARVARQNVFNHHLEDMIEVVQADPMTGIKAEADWRRADIILSNPPYIPSGAIAGLQREVRDYEPRLALDGGADGLDCYRRLAKRSALMHPGAQMLMEIGLGQERAVADIMISGGLEVQQVVPDYAGIARVVVCVRG